MSKKIRLSGKHNELSTIVDNDDYQWLKGHALHLVRGYVKWYNPNTKKSEAIHRAIMNCKPGKFIDHINRDRLDNRKENLRIANRSQNNANMRIQDRNKLGVKGVCLHRGRYQASITVKKKTIFLGNYDTAKEAALAYDEAAKMYHGEFALTNKELHVMEALR